MKKTLPALLVCAALQGCGPGETQVATDSGRLVIVGGALQADNAAVYSAVVSAREGDGPLCVIPAASSDPAEAIDGAVATLAEYGGIGSAKGVLLSTDSPERARDPAVASELAGCMWAMGTGRSMASRCTTGSRCSVNSAASPIKV